MNYFRQYKKWLSSENIDDKLKQELLNIKNNEAEIKSRFYQNLSFGTAGIRGILGAGINRMNVNIVAWATKGLANCLLEQDSGEISVVIGYDVRYMSREFAEVAAMVLADSGIQVHLFPTIAPTPLVSYGVRKLKTNAGIMITASHNPKEYNGYKVYGSDGAQIVGSMATQISGQLEKVDPLGIKVSKFNIENKNINYIENNIIENYKNEVLNVSFEKNLNKDISVVFTPLNGTGQMVEEVLKDKGYKNVITVEEERYPDSEFKTTNIPNPENPNVFRLAEQTGKLHNADILLATDPDADRVGVEILNNNEYVFLTGNQIGILLVNYILNKKMPENSYIIKTIVTSKLVDKLAKKGSVGVADVLVGFKNIYELVGKWELIGENKFIMGFEESLGFGLATFVRDKDAILASSIIVEMAAYYKKQGKTLIDILNEIYEEFGYEDEQLFSIVIDTIEDETLVDKIMEDFICNPVKTIDNLKLIETVEHFNIDSSKDSTLIYKFTEENWFAIRPSGTEPKVKFYVYGYGKDLLEAKANSQKIRKVIENRIKTY